MISRFQWPEGLCMQRKAVHVKVASKFRWFCKNVNCKPFKISVSCTDEIKTAWNTETKNTQFCQSTSRLHVATWALLEELIHFIQISSNLDFKDTVESMESMPQLACPRHCR